VVHCLEKGWYYEATSKLLEGLGVAIAARIRQRSGRTDGAEWANESLIPSEDKKESRTYRNRLTRNA
jgi:hypothetical protein